MPNLSFYTNASDQERTLQLLRLEAEKDPRDRLTRYRLGMTLESLGQIQEATEHLLSATDPHASGSSLSLDLQAKAHTRLAQLYLAQNHLEAAVRHCESSVMCGSEDPLTFLLMAIIHMHSYNFGTAARTLERGLEVVQNAGSNTFESGMREEQLRLALAHCKRLDGRPEEAIPEYQACAQDDPENLDAWIGLAECESQRENFPQAQSAFRRALEIDPESETAQRGLEELSAAN